MAIITLSSSLPLGPGCGFGQQRYDLAAMSESTGAEQTRLLGPSRWTLTLTQPANLRIADAGAWQAIVANLRGKSNVLLAWDPARIAPRGTYRGSPTLTGTHAIGASSVTLGGGTAAGTLLAGDWLQIGSGLGTSQLVMVTANATANGSGAITATIEPTLRIGFAGATAVTWSYAGAYFRQRTDGTQWRYAAGGGPSRVVVTGITLDMLETWS